MQLGLMLCHEEEEENEEAEAPLSMAILISA